MNFCEVLTICSTTKKKWKYYNNKLEKEAIFSSLQCNYDKENLRLPNSWKEITANEILLSNRPFSVFSSSSSSFFLIFRHFKFMSLVEWNYVCLLIYWINVETIHSKKKNRIENGIRTIVEQRNVDIGFNSTLFDIIGHKTNLVLVFRPFIWYAWNERVLLSFSSNE